MKTPVLILSLLLAFHPLFAQNVNVCHDYISEYNTYVAYNAEDFLCLENDDKSFILCNFMVDIEAKSTSTPCITIDVAETDDGGKVGRMASLTSATLKITLQNNEVLTKANVKKSKGSFLGDKMTAYGMLFYPNGFTSSKVGSCSQSYVLSKLASNDIKTLQFGNIVFDFTKCIEKDKTYSSRYFKALFKELNKLSKNQLLNQIN